MRIYISIITNLKKQDTCNIASSRPFEVLTKKDKKKLVSQRNTRRAPFCSR